MQKNNINTLGMDRLTGYGVSSMYGRSSMKNVHGDMKNV